VRTDLDAATSVAGLYACGEVASSGVHGANRLASNSLLESTVFAHRAVEAALHRSAEMPPPSPDAAVDPPLGEAGRGVDAASLMDRLRDAMWEGAGLVREAEGLARTAAVLDEVGDRCDMDPVTATTSGLSAALITAQLVCAAAGMREESRGSHRRADFPSTDDRWLASLIMQKDRGARRDSHARTNH
jgi:L-aspartate oxidase